MHRKWLVPFLEILLIALLAGILFFELDRNIQQEKRIEQLEAEVALLKAHHQDGQWYHLSMVKNPEMVFIDENGIISVLVDLTGPKNLTDELNLWGKAYVRYKPCDRVDIEEFKGFEDGVTKWQLTEAAKALYPDFTSHKGWIVTFYWLDTWGPPPPGSFQKDYNC